MCNRYRLRADQIAIAAAMGIPIEVDAELPPGELFPRRPALVVRQHEAMRRGSVMLWGFPPPANARGPVTNVRNLASPFWRTALANPERRCLVPASEFCEWQGEPGAKLARWFAVPSQPVFAFAGVWRPLAEGGCFAMLTCEPNALVVPIHAKAMPVILHPEDHGRWLTAPLAEVLPLATPFPSQLMALEPVV